MAKERRTILISGGGIAGLTAALALAQTGHRIEVLERSAKFESVGAGIQISPNAFRVLADLGLEGQLKTIATVPDSIQLKHAYSGKQLAEIPLGPEATSKYGVPYLVIHRADLQDILVKACKEQPEIVLHMASETIDVAAHKNGVTALVRQPKRVNEMVGKALVVADGVGSRVRKEAMGLKPPVYSGTTAWRALVPIDAAKNGSSRENTHLWLGPDTHAVTYPVRSNRYLNVVAFTKQEFPDKSDWASVALLKAQFENWHEDFTALFKAKVRWSTWPVYETDSINPMMSGPVVAIGDAAHAMLPYAAQGAAMAIEDAVVLARQIGSHDQIELAFEAYQRERLPRIKRTMRLARSNGTIYHLKEPFSSCRDFALKFVSGSRLLDRQDWLYDWQH